VAAPWDDGPEASPHVAGCLEGQQRVVPSSSLSGEVTVRGTSGERASIVDGGTVTSMER
jgi:hypothetical protein